MEEKKIFKNPENTDINRHQFFRFFLINYLTFKWSHQEKL